MSLNNYNCATHNKNMKQFLISMLEKHQLHFECSFTVDEQMNCQMKIKQMGKSNSLTTFFIIIQSSFLKTGTHFLQRLREF